MKKIVILLITGFVVFSCNANAKNDQKRVGSDLHNGCKGSAGYVWSTLKKGCIRPFEEGIKLNPVKESNFAAYLYIKDNEIEVFSAESAQTMLFKEKKEDVWVKSDWKIKKEKEHYYLFKGEQLMYNN